MTECVICHNTIRFAEMNPKSKWNIHGKICWNCFGDLDKKDIESKRKDTELKIKNTDYKKISDKIGTIGLIMLIISLPIFIFSLIWKFWI